MAFQSAANVRVFQTTGLPGEQAREGPWRALPWNVVSPNEATRPNLVGNAFTATANDFEAEPGGAGIFAGILGRPKEYALLGTAAGTLEDSYAVANNRPVQLITMGILYATLSVGGALGDLVFFEADALGVGTGALASAPSVAPTNHILIPGATVVVQSIDTVPGLAIIQLT